MPDAIILFAHGARETEWAEPFKKIQRLVAERLPDTRVELAFLEIMQPSLPDTITTLAAERVREIRVVPLFLAQGGHLKHDLPRLVSDLKTRHPGLSIEISRPIGEVDDILQRIAQWICADQRTDC
ncbi:MAG: sirohydrochlorin chelatase [Burkholderiales bacterium]